MQAMPPIAKQRELLARMQRNSSPSPFDQAVTRDPASLLVHCRLAYMHDEIYSSQSLPPHGIEHHHAFLGFVGPGPESKVDSPMGIFAGYARKNKERVFLWVSLPVS